MVQQIMEGYVGTRMRMADITGQKPDTAEV